MGVLDDKWQEEPNKFEKNKFKRNPKQSISEEDSIPVTVNCGICGDLFSGQAWMLKSSKVLKCEKCYADQFKQ